VLESITLLRMNGKRHFGQGAVRRRFGRIFS